MGTCPTADPRSARGRAWSCTATPWGEVKSEKLEVRGGAYFGVFAGKFAGAKIHKKTDFRLIDKDDFSLEERYGKFRRCS